MKSSIQCIGYETNMEHTFECGFQNWRLVYFGIMVTATGVSCNVPFLPRLSCRIMGESCILWCDGVIEFSRISLN